MKENSAENTIGFNSIEEVKKFYENKTPWEILGVSKNADADEIKKAYRLISQKYHPDKYANDPIKLKIAEEIFKYINNANEKINSKENNQDVNYENSFNKDDDRGFRESDLEYDAPFVDDITEQLWHRGPVFSDSDGFKSRFDKLLGKYKGNNKKEEKIKIILDRALGERGFLDSIVSWLHSELSKSEENQELPEEFTSMINKWFKIGLNKKEVFENGKIRNLILDHLAESATYGPKKFSFDFKNWSYVGIKLKDFLDSEELKEIIDAQLANIAKYDKKRSASKKQEWIECINNLKQ